MALTDKIDPKAFQNIGVSAKSTKQTQYEAQVKEVESYKQPNSEAAPQKNNGNFFLNEIKGAANTVLAGAGAVGSTITKSFGDLMKFSGQINGYANQKLLGDSALLKKAFQFEADTGQKIYNYGKRTDTNIGDLFSQQQNMGANVIKTLTEAALPGAFEVDAGDFLLHNHASYKQIGGGIGTYFLNKLTAGEGASLIENLGAKGMKNTSDAVLQGVDDAIRQSPNLARQNAATVVENIMKGNVPQHFGKPFVRQVTIGMLKDASIGAGYSAASAFSENQNPTVNDIITGGLFGATIKLVGVTGSSGLKSMKYARSERPALAESAIARINDHFAQMSTDGDYRAYIGKEISLVPKNVDYGAAQSAYLTSAAENAPGIFRNHYEPGAASGSRDGGVLNYHGVTVEDATGSESYFTFKNGKPVIGLGPQAQAGQFLHEIGHFIQHLSGKNAQLFSNEIKVLAPNEPKFSEAFAIAIRRVLSGEVNPDSVPGLNGLIKSVYGESRNMADAKAVEMVRRDDMVNEAMQSGQQADISAIKEKIKAKMAETNQQIQGMDSKAAGEAADAALAYMTKDYSNIDDWRGLARSQGVLDNPTSPSAASRKRGGPLLSRDDRKQLSDMGYTPKEVQQMDQQTAQQIVSDANVGTVKARNNAPLASTEQPIAQNAPATEQPAKPVVEANAQESQTQYREKLKQDNAKIASTTASSKREPYTGDAITRRNKAQLTGNEELKPVAESLRTAAKSETAVQKGPQYSWGALEKNTDLSAPTLGEMKQKMLSRTAGEITTVEGSLQQKQVIANEVKNFNELFDNAKANPSKEAEALYKDKYEEVVRLIAAHDANLSEYGRGLVLAKKGVIDRQYAEEFMNKVKQIQKDNPGGNFDAVLNKIKDALPESVISNMARKFYSVWYPFNLSGIGTLERIAVDNIGMSVANTAAQALSRAVFHPKDFFMDGGFADLMGSGIKGTGTGLKESGQIIKGDLSSIAENDREGIQKSIKWLQFISRSMIAMDKATTGGAAGTMVSILKREAIKSGTPMTEAEIAAAFEREVKYNARQGPMQGTLGVIGKKMMEAREIEGLGPVLRLIIPYVKTPINVMNAQMDYLPIVSYAKIFINQNKGTQTEREINIAKSVIGTMLAGASMEMAVKSYSISAGGPKDSNERNLLYAQGWKPYSIKVGKMWIPYRYWGAVGVVMAAAGEISDQKWQGVKNEDTSTKLVGSLIQFAKFNLTTSFLSGLDRFFGAVSSGQEASVTKYVEGIVASAVPNPKLVTDTISRVRTMYGDNYIRKPQGIAEIIGADLGFDVGNPMLDPFGQPIKKDYTSGVSFGFVKNDPVIKGLSDNGLQVGAVSKTFKQSGRTYKLTPDQYFTYERLYGQSVKPALAEMLSQPGFNDLTDAEKQSQAKSVRATVRADAKAQLEAKYPKLAGSALDVAPSDPNAP